MQTHQTPRVIHLSQNFHRALSLSLYYDKHQDMLKQTVRINQTLSSLQNRYPTKRILPFKYAFRQRNAYTHTHTPNFQYLKSLVIFRF